MLPTARLSLEDCKQRIANRKGRYDKEKLLWQFTVAIKSDPVGSAKEAQVAVAALQASAQGEGCSGMNADTAYTVEPLAKPTFMSHAKSAKFAK